MTNRHVTMFLCLPRKRGKKKTKKLKQGFSGPQLINTEDVRQNTALSQEANAGKGEDGEVLVDNYDDHAYGGDRESV